MNYITQMPESIRDQKHILRFGQDENFRVLLFTDVQACPPAPCERTVKDMNAIIDKENPDLILFCGDNASECRTSEQLRNYLKVLTAHIEEKRIPWAHVYGNHDDECYRLADGSLLRHLHRSEQQKVYEEFLYCVSKAGISMLTTLYADRLAAEGITVNEVRPGIIMTDMTSAVKDKYDQMIGKGVFPIARWGTPEDVANAFLFLR